VASFTEGLDLIGDEPVTTYATLEQALEHRNTLNNLIETIAREKEAENPYADQVSSLQIDGIQEVSYDTLNELQVLLKHQDFLQKLLTSKDSFIRKKIIDQNINHLNHRLNFYLEKLGLPHEVKFQSDLSVEIDLLGRDFDFEQLSRGEMNRVILSTSWAFRDVWESLNQSVNLMFIDEMIDNGLDAQGSEAALDLMKRMARERGKNVFLISHRDDLVGRVNKLMLVKKENSFTRFDSEADDVE
jgi:DNA repair exonuclease SbcCD ATPase subunit